MNSYHNKQNFLEKVVANAIKISKSRRLVVALSGGADSVALVASLSSVLRGYPRSSVSGKTDFTNPEKKFSPGTGSDTPLLLAAHCNFHLRGEESMRDQHFVEKLCEELEVPLLIMDFDVPAYQEAHPGTSLEMACRDLRYEWFDQLMTEYNADRIATGHNADDNIETLFLNLLRGSGTSGLKGMVSDNGRVLRPLLTVHRTEILSYLESRGLSYIIDSSNLTSDFRRNFLRNEVLPLLRQRWPGLDKALDRSIKLLKSENDIIEQAVAQALPLPAASPDGSPMTPPLARSTVLSFPAPELLVRRYILPLRPFTTTPGEIVAAMRADKSDIRRWTLPGGTVTLRASRLHITPD